MFVISVIQVQESCCLNMDFAQADLSFWSLYSVVINVSGYRRLIHTYNLEINCLPHHSVCCLTASDRTKISPKPRLQPSLTRSTPGSKTKPRQSENTAWCLSACTLPYVCRYFTSTIPPTSSCTACLDRGFEQQCGV